MSHIFAALNVIYFRFFLLFYFFYNICFLFHFVYFDNKKINFKLLEENSFVFLTKIKQQQQQQPKKTIFSKISFNLL